MARIIVDPPPARSSNLAADFSKAVTVLLDGGFDLRSGTRLTSRYAVLVVEDSAAGPAIEKLAAENLKVSRDSR